MVVRALASLALLATADAAVPPADSSPGATVTELGLPMGEPVIQTIGAKGGTVRSPDGDFIVTVPAGALRADTRLTLRALTNSLPGGAGMAYSLDTGGVRLSLPVQVELLVHGATPSAGNPIGLAYQNAQGAWFAFPDASVSSASGVAFSAKSATATATATANSAPSGAASPASAGGDVRASLRASASDLAIAIGVFNFVNIEPSSATLRIGQEISLKITNCAISTGKPRPISIPDSGPDELTPLTPLKCTHPKVAPTSIHATAGKLTRTANVDVLTYTAPDKKPKPNPVTITATYENAGDKGNEVTLVAQITVLDDQMAYYRGPLEFDGRTTGGDPPGTVAYFGTAQLKFTKNPAHVAPGDVTGYDASGTATITYTYTDTELRCDPKVVQLPVTGDLNVYDADADPGDRPGRAKAYIFFFTGTKQANAEPVTFSCHEKDGASVQRDISANLLFRVTVDCTTEPGVNSPHYNDSSVLWQREPRPWKCKDFIGFTREGNARWKLLGTPALN